jgi:hypothetical protein
MVPRWLNRRDWRSLGTGQFPGQREAHSLDGMKTAQYSILGCGLSLEDSGTDGQRCSPLRGAASDFMGRGDDQAVVGRLPSILDTRGT